MESFSRTLYYSLLPFFRHVGLFFPLFLGYAIYLLLARRKPSSWYLTAALFFIGFILPFALVIVYDVEFRRYLLFPFLVSTIAIKIMDSFGGLERMMRAVLAINLFVIGVANLVLFQVW